MHVSIEFKLQDPPSDNRLEHPLVEMLKAVDETGSIRLAARKLNKSYRNVWGHLKNWELDWGVELIVWGVTGKGATLTPQALRFLKDQEKIQDRYAHSIAQMRKDLKASVANLTRSRLSRHEARSHG